MPAFTQVEVPSSRIFLISTVAGSHTDSEPSGEGSFQRILHSLKRGLLYASVVLMLDTVALGADSLILGRNMFHYLTLFTLGQAAVLFFVGGAWDVGTSLSFSRFIKHSSKKSAGSMEDHKRAQWKAVPIIVAGILLMTFSFALAYPLN